MSEHLKSYFAPKSWKVKKKYVKFISKPNPGPHSIGMSLPLNVIIRDILGYAKSMKEVKFILKNKNVAVDGVRRRDSRFPVGLFDVLSFNETNEYFRVILDTKGKIELVKIDKQESSHKICKITGKTAVKGKVQLNLNDGKNIVTDDPQYKVGDAVLLALDGKAKIREKISLDKGTIIYLTDGKHIGETGKVVDIIGNRILYKTNEAVVETLKEAAFPVGKDKLLIKLG
ncbi:MAG: 30S ribosomal protein S4e [Nanoarchaeota archaeon]